MATSDFSDVLVHVGYHKCGSTLLQERVFTPDHGFWSPWRQDFYHRHVLLDRPDELWPTRIRAAFLEQIDEGRARGLRPVLSCEALSGDPWRMGQANGHANFHVADALAQALPNAAIVLVHRAQPAMVLSLYKHTVRSHWRYSLESFLDQTPLGRGMAPVFNLAYLEYSWLLERYQALFGPDRVLPLALEALETWAVAWTDFLGVEVSQSWFSARHNPGYAAATVQLKRIFNHVIPAGAEPNSTRTGRLVNAAAFRVDQHVPTSVRERSERRLAERTAALIGNRFVEDNARLARLVPGDWSALGYR